MRTRALPAVGRPARTALVLMAAAALAACSGSDDAQVRETTAAEQLAAAKVKVDAATSLHLTLRSRDLPASANGVIGADGSGTHAPAFKGTLNARISGFEAKVDVVAISGLLHVKLPFTTEFVEADPREYDAPDPARLFSADGGISSLLTATIAPVEGPKTRVGKEVLTTITGTLPGTSVERLLSIGDASKTFKVTYGITDPGGELRTVTMSGPFYQRATPTPATSATATSTAATPTYLLTLDRYGAPVEISKP